jgi:3-phosphoshikimate 1-carboxyvinyltransferase
MAAVGALADAGLGIEHGPGGIVVNGPKTIRGWRHLDAATMPDGSMALAIAAACCVTSSTITGLRTLRVKESDRISALETELTRAGAEVRSDDDSLHIRPVPSPLLSPEAPPLEVPTYDDHRMAMAFAILGLRRGGISVLDPSCVSKSYPGFWSDLEQVVE